MTPPDIPLPAWHSLPPELPGRKAAGHIQPWVAQYAEWLVRQPLRPTMEERVEKACELRQKHTHYRTVVKYEKSTLFKDYYAECCATQLRRAQEMFDARSGEAVVAHFEGLREARAKHDYRAYPAFTVPVLDRVRPKKVEAVAPTTQVVINLSGEQLRVLQQAPIMTEHEVLALPGAADDTDYEQA